MLHLLIAAAAAHRHRAVGRDGHRAADRALARPPRPGRLPRDQRLQHRPGDPDVRAAGLFVTADFPGTADFGPYGRAGLATLLALALFALPPMITNSYVAVREVPADVKEAADGMGMTGGQKFFRVELPLSLPLVMSGVRLALVQVWATATIAALVAGPGLGRVITDGFFRTNYGKGIAGAVVVGLVALVLELSPRRPAAGPRPRRGRHRT